MKNVISLNLLCITCVFLLSSCGEINPEPYPYLTEEPDETLRAFEEQELAWAVCDPNLFPENTRELFIPLANRLECTTLKTPLDWNNPTRDAINLGVLRVKAGDETKRKGAIILNPGGPGGDGLYIGALFGLIFATGDTQDVGDRVAPELLSQVSEQYDILGFSPRGVGGSFQFFCGNNKEAPTPELYTNRSKENVQAILEEAHVYADACKNNPLSDLITTEQTVQDMDLIRRLLNDEKLNYLGFSYGSWLGSWYAKRFPEHVGNMVLDANTDFSAGFQDVFTLQGLGFQRSFDDVALPYAARNSSFYELGETKEDIKALYMGLREDLKAALLQGDTGLTDLLYSPRTVPVVAVSLMAAKGVNTILDELELPPSPERYEAFLAEVATHSYASNPDLSAQVAEFALVLAQDYLSYRERLGKNLELSPAATLNPSRAVFTAVTCNDSPWNQDPSFYAQLGDEQNEIYPLLGGNVTSQPCAYWGEPETRMPAIPEDFPELLLVQSGYDPATPSEGAIEAFKSLPNAHLIYVENELSHTVFPYSTDCVDAKVAQYLLDGTLPSETISNCAALPLPGETQVFAPGSAPSIGSSTQSFRQQAARSVNANPLYDVVHELMHEDAAALFNR